MGITLNMQKRRKVIHVELREPYNGKKHYYFGSITAIYDTLPHEVIGVAKETIWKYDLPIKEYSNRFCTIRMGCLIQKHTARGKRKDNHDNGEDI